MNRVTQKILNKLPQWMKMRTDENSVGAQFLNVFGLEFEEIEEYLDEQLNSAYITTAKLSDLDWIYKTVGVPIKLEDIILVTADGNTLIESYNVKSFYNSSDTNIYIIDYTTKTIYYRNKYTDISISINNVVFPLEQELHHVWNVFDEFGLLLGIKRLYQETNYNFRIRILDVFKRPGNTSKEGLKNSIARDLGISPSHVRLDNLINQDAFSSSLLTEEGAPTQRFLNIIKSLNTRATSIWEYAVWDTTYWQALDEDLIGLDYLPRLWSLHQDTILDSYYQSGIGDGDDCKITILEAQDDTQEFNYYLSAQGTQEINKVVYPPHKFSYEIYAEGIIPKDSSLPEEYYYTVEAAEIMPLNVDIKAYDDTDRIHSDDFSSTGAYTLVNTEVVDSNKIQNLKKRYLQVIVNMKSNGLVTPTLNSISINYTDAGSLPQTIDITSVADFSTPPESIEQSNINATDTGDLQLYMGTFDYTIGQGSEIEWASYEEESNFMVIGETIKLKGL
jgi:hypothetical protein